MIATTFTRRLAVAPLTILRLRSQVSCGDITRARNELSVTRSSACALHHDMHLRDIVGRIPADRLMIETDAPYILPRDIRPKPRSRRNEPALLPWVLRAVASARGESPEALAASSTKTALAFFTDTA